MNPLTYWDLLERHTAEELSTLAMLKRVAELIAGDPSFRDAAATSHSEAARLAAQYGCDLAPEDIASITGALLRQRSSDNSCDATLALWRRLQDGKLLLREQVLAYALQPTSPPFDRWRARQRRRLASEIGTAAEVVPHSLIAFELSRGCSVGCSFCGVDAARFQGPCRYTEEIRQEWQEMLRGLDVRFGKALGSGFLYWGTDPLDNPDYCAFAEDFRSVAGFYPQVTTAIPLRDEALTRKVLATSRGATLVPHRFSVLSLNVLRRLFRTFSPIELLDVDLVLQHKEGNALKANAGRGYYGKPNPVYLPDGNGADLLAPGTIACVTGFLVNLAERRIRMISPTIASARWPNGYIVFDERHYEDAAGFLAAVDKMIDGQTRAGIDLASRLRFRPDLLLRRQAGGFQVESPAVIHQFDHFGPLAEVVQQGGLSVGEIVGGARTRGCTEGEEMAFLTGIYNAALVERAA